MKPIKFNDLSAQWSIIEPEVMPKVQQFLRDGHYIGGPYVEAFEKEFAEYTGSKYAIGTSNGSDGLKLAIEALDIEGDINVIVPANGFMADVFAAKYQKRGKYTITFVDHDENFQMDVDLLEKHVDSVRNKFHHIVILPVHLYGHPANMPRIMEIAERAKAHVIEDASQAQGAYCYGKMVGSWGDIAVYSLYPGKNLGACGDAGIITTNSEFYKNRLMMLRNYGSPKKYHHDIDGLNHRLDPLQAIILSEKLKHLDEWNFARLEVAKEYLRLLSGVNGIELPKTASHVNINAYHIFPILLDNYLVRSTLIKHLEEKGIPTIIHYPIALQSCKCNQDLIHGDNSSTSFTTSMNQFRLLSLPIHPFMEKDQIEYVCNTTKEFLNDTHKLHNPS